jgi:hypothetical protein
MHRVIFLALLISLPAQAFELGSRLLCAPGYMKVTDGAHPYLELQDGVEVDRETEHFNQFDIQNPTPGIRVFKSNGKAKFEVDLGKMNGTSDEARSWQWVTLNPANEDSAYPIDLAFGPNYQTRDTASLSDLRIRVGHAKAITRGLFWSTLITTAERLNSPNYGDMYYSQTQYTTDLDKNNDFVIELPALNSNLVYVWISCVVN